MTYNDFPLLIAAVSVAYLSIVYILLTVAQRTRRIPRVRD